MQPPDILWIHWRVYNSIANTSKGVLFCPLLMPMSNAFSISFNKTLLHKSSERSSLVSGPGLNSSPPEAKNPASHRSATTLHLGGSSGILQDKMGLIIYVSLLLLTPEILSLPFDPQDNAFLSWAHSYAAFHNWSNCWVCGPLPSSSVKGVPWWTSPLQGKDFLQVCKYLQQSHVMPLLKLMTSNNLKMD